MDKHCASCGHNTTCQEVYQGLGHSRVPNITGKAIEAFIVPILTFIISAGAAYYWLRAWIDNLRLLTAVVLGIGAFAAFAVVLLVCGLTRKSSGQTGCPK